MTRFILVFCLLALVPLTSAEPLPVDGLQGLDKTHYHVFRAESLDKDFHIFVGLPDDYDESGEGNYPTVYILDGGLLYPQFKSYSGYLQAGEEAPAMILVAISYGTNDWQQGNDRSHDFTAPTDEREFWGGAEDFQVFLSEELIPFIERLYRSNSERRVVFGQSLGGQFVMYTAQTKPGLFWGHIASNPALHRNLPLFLEMKPEPPVGASHLFVGDAENDAARFYEPRQEWIRHWTTQSELPWRLHVETLEGHNHFSAPPASFRRGIRWLFAD